ncbi:SDR family oxidoreductase [Actinocrispum wychmicini]|uniref:NADP-dependent 3-hydroxy acid dehydrogenase YdfG n=1 Tax=Actinocrispum wychmicini TaxID=1213861 RepID=A0A4V2S7E4_9PSEU|nr:SDR family NAD(P)-dependent oxidoreductase [Actinocrispum wychmicini]TCO59610.1 NADP-dependent 3-hydroxy acid dehydrogenase YdfG [Actinocrispum wychmicini]
MDSLSGRTAFVTGGANGIGLAIACALASWGVSVAVADLDEPALRRAEAELSTVTRARSYRLDVRDRQRYAEVADTVEAELGPVSIVVNNAGILDSVSPARMDHTLWDYVMGVNANGVYNGLQAFVPRMIERGLGGHIVNTASAAGLFVDGQSLLYRSGFLYHASKFAVVGLSESLRVELAHHGIGVSVLCPGPVATDGLDNARRLRPADAPERSAKVETILAAAQNMVRDQGVQPSVVGELVVDAIIHNRPYILTAADNAAPIRARMEALLDAVPTDRLE